MKIVCAWCDKEKGEKNGGGVEGVSHSICEECLEKLEAGNGIKAKGGPDE